MLSYFYCSYSLHIVWHEMLSYFYCSYNLHIVWHEMLSYFVFLKHSQKKGKYPFVLSVTVIFVGNICQSQLMSFLRYLCLFAYSSVQHILCCVFALFFVVLCTLCCQFLWIVHFWLPFRYFLTFIYLMYPMLPVSLDCPFLIAPSVFSNVYLSCIPYVASFSWLSIFDCPFGIL